MHIIYNRTHYNFQCVCKGRAIFHLVRFDSYKKKIYMNRRTKVCSGSQVNYCRFFSSLFSSLALFARSAFSWSIENKWNAEHIAMCKCGKGINAKEIARKNTPTTKQSEKSPFPSPANSILFQPILTDSTTRFTCHTCLIFTFNLYKNVVSFYHPFLLPRPLSFSLSHTHTPFLSLCRVASLVYDTLLPCAHPDLCLTLFIRSSHLHH